MKILRSRTAAMTLVELMVTVAVIALAGAGIFEILRTGMILFGKNTAINLSHSEGRFALLNLQQDLNAAASTPELTNSAGTIISGTATGPAAGVYFQDYAGGTFCISQNSPTATTGTIPASATSIQVITGTNFRPVPGETIHIQVLPITTVSTTSLAEATLSGSSAYSPATTGTATSYTVTLATAIGSSINLVDAVDHTTALHVACFFTTPIIYAVQNGTLVRFSLDPAGSGKMLSTVLSYNVTSTTPFSMPTVNSSPQNTFLSVTNLTAMDASSNYQGYRGLAQPGGGTSSNQGYHGGATQFNIQIPHFAQLTVQY